MLEVKLGNNLHLDKIQADVVLFFIWNTYVVIILFRLSQVGAYG